MIEPTVGRKVWFYENNSPPDAEPMDATIIKAWGTGPEAPVNLDVCMPLSGEHRLYTSVVVGDETTRTQHYRWMPYQKGQAARHAA